MSIKIEKVWHYPRPAIWEYYRGTIEVIHNNEVIAKTKNAIRILETSHPPTYYIPNDNVVTSLLNKNNDRSFCEWKGTASYFDYYNNNEYINNIGWCYSNPYYKFLPIKNFISFYASKVDKCFVDKKEVFKQEGSYYGGWITDNLIGPFKGGEGTEGW